MTNLRTTLTILVVARLGMGGIGATLAAFSGTATEWAVKMDAAPIRLLCLLVLVGAIGFAFVPNGEEVEA